MQEHVNQGRFYVAQLDRALAGLADSHRAIEPAPGAKTAGWILGHLSVTGDFARRVCGRTPMCPKGWRAAYNPGTTPSTDEATYPSMAELSTTVRAVYTDLCDAAVAADARVLGVPNPFEPLRPTFPTAGEFVGYMLTGHFAYHLGQLVAWRAAAGLGRIEPDAATVRVSARPA